MYAMQLISQLGFGYTRSVEKRCPGNPSGLFGLRTSHVGLGGQWRSDPLTSQRSGHYILGVADFPKVHYSPSFAASSFHWAPRNRETHMMDHMNNGGFRWGDPAQAGLNPVSDNFTHPKLFSAYEAGNPDRQQFLCHYGKQAIRIVRTRLQLL